MSQDSDRALWQRSAEGDSDAFAALFRRHGNKVYNHCFRRTASWALAEDLMSVVFLQAWRKRNEVNFITDSVLPWLLAVANNVCRNGMRSQYRYRRVLARVVAVESIEIEDDALDRIDAERRMAVVLEHLDTLSELDRDIISLCVWSELDQASVAAVLGIPVGTVKSRLSRARAHLRQAMEPDSQNAHEKSESHTAIRPKETR